MKENSMTIIGFGIMGKIYANIFSKDFNIRVVSSRDISNELLKCNYIYSTNLEEAVDESKYIVIAAPLHALDEVVSKLNHYVKEDNIVFDVCSAKVKAMKSLENTKCKSFGTHMLSSNIMAVCGEIDYELSNCLLKQNIEIRKITAEEHDKWNSIIGIGHFLALSLAHCLSDYEKEVLSQVGSGKKLLALIEQVTSNAPITYQETQMDNEFTNENRIRLINSLKEYNDRLENGEFIF